MKRILIGAKVVLFLLLVSTSSLALKYYGERLVAQYQTKVAEATLQAHIELSEKDALACKRGGQTVVVLREKENHIDDWVRQVTAALPEEALDEVAYDDRLPLDVRRVLHQAYCDAGGKADCSERSSPDPPVLP